MVPSGEGGTGMGLGRDIQGSLIDCNVQKKNLKVNQTFTSIEIVCINYIYQYLLHCKKTKKCLTFYLLTWK